MNDTSPQSEHPQAATLLPAPWSESGIDDLRKAARKRGWPGRTLLRLQADVLAADRVAHMAQSRGDAKALDAAIMARIDAQGRLDAKKRQIAEMVMSALAIAWECLPIELSDLFGLFPPTPDLTEIAEAVAELQAKVAELFAMKGVA